jgi:hypothetical protein
MAFKLIQTVTVPSGGYASIEFTNIPQTYRDLVIQMSSNKTANGINISSMYLNNTTNNGGYGFYWDSNGTGTPRNGYWLNGGPYEQGTGSLFSSSYIFLPNYSTSRRKTWQIDTMNSSISTSNYIAWLGQSSNTLAPVSSIKITASDANWAQYSIATLYGIK